MLSRAAHSIYWMSRYLERADNVARFIAVNLHLILDMGLARNQAQWKPLVSASGDDDDFEQRYDNHNEKNVIRFLTFDAKNPNSILSCVQKARENARTLREVISSEMWESINAFYHRVEKQSRKRQINDLQAFLSEVRDANHLYTGLLENTMSHDEAWQFARIGQLLERADKTARILDVKYFILLPTLDYFDSPYDTVEWGAVLKSASGFEVYQKRFHHTNYRDVTQFLILDQHFPRAIRHCIDSATHALTQIIGLLQVKVSAVEEMNKLKAMLDSTEINTILTGGLHEFIDVFQLKLNIIDAALYRSFFALDTAESY